MPGVDRAARKKVPMTTHLPLARACLFGILLAPLVARAQDAAPRVNAHGEPIPRGAVAVLGSNRLRHIGALHLFVAPDGKTFRTVGHGQSLRTWDTATGKLLDHHELPGNGDLGGLSPDGKTMAMSRLQSTQLWDVTTSAQRVDVALPLQAQATKFAFAANSTAVACEEMWGPDGIQLTLVDAYQGGRKVVANLKEPALDFKLAPDGQRLYVATRGALTCLDAAGKEIWKADTKALRVLLRTDGKTLFTVPLEEGGKGQVWDCATGKPVGPAVVVSSCPWSYAAALAPDGKHTAVNTLRGVEVFDLVAARVVHVFPGGADCLAFTPDGRTLLTCRGVLQSYDVASGKSLYADAREWGHSHWVGHLVWSPDGKRLLSGSHFDPCAFVWEVAAGKPVCRLTGPYQAPLTVGFAGGGKQVVAAGSLGELWTWDAGNGKLTNHLTVKSGGKDIAFGLTALSRDGKFLGDNAMLGNKNALTVRDTATGKLLHALEVPPMERLHQGFTSTGLVTVTAEGRSRDLATGKLSPALECLEGLMPERVVISPDGWLALGQVVRVPPPEGDLVKGPVDLRTRFAVWERASGKVLRSLDYMELKVATWALGADARCALLAIGHEVFVHDLVSNTVLARLDTGPLTGLSVSPDGRLLATTGTGCTITVWDLDAVTRPAKAPPLTKEESVRLWKDLADTDPARGPAAVWRLAQGGDAAVAVLAKQIRPVAPVPTKELEALVRDLESPTFKTRDAATQRLRKLGKLAEPALRVRLGARPPLEVERRLQLLLEPLRGGEPARGDGLRELRAVVVAERIGTSAALALLREWASGAAGADLTEAARAALERWEYAHAQ
jgi:WD40 repeat protein